jgi:triosephosphate isomerase
MRRRKLVAGNWKMFKGPQEADVLAQAIKRLVVDAPAVDVAVAPPFLSIPAVVARLKHSGVSVAGQDLHPEAQGAFTGAVSAEMLRQAGCTYGIVGHSERRTLFGDTDEAVGKKVRAAFRAGLLPIVCVGETLPERDGGQAERVVIRQLEAAYAGTPPDQAASSIVAYEPVWAIGTGRTASAEQAQAMHATIRAWAAERFPAFVAAQLRILYGGSVKGGNAASLLGQADVDGALVGGASLDPEEFGRILSAAAAVSG